MIYSNDESDKSLRKKNHFIEVYLQPIAIALLIAAAVYLFTRANYIRSVDMVFIYYLSLLTGLFIYGRNTRNWLKMPDGSWQNIKGMQTDFKLSASEPANYEDEYFI